MNIIKSIGKAFSDFWRSVVIRFFTIMPSAETIDTSGIVYSDYRKDSRGEPLIEEGCGWIKGWVADTPLRNIIVVCKHSNPAPGDTVWCRNKFGAKVVRTITHVNYAPFLMSSDPVVDAYRRQGDIAVCRLSRPMPTTCKAYTISTKTLDNPKSVVVIGHKSHTFSRSTIFAEGNWLVGRHRFDLLVPGNSGLPWFVWEAGEWKVATHTTKGERGEGPWYAHPDIYKELNLRIEQLSVRP